MGPQNDTNNQQTPGAAPAPEAPTTPPAPTDPTPAPTGDTTPPAPTPLPTDAQPAKKGKMGMVIGLVVVVVVLAAVAYFML